MTKRSNGARAFLLLSSVALILAGIFFIRCGFDKKDNYYHSEGYSSLDVNAYVGGDAYNFIINGTYFAGYCALGGALLICGTITGAIGLSPEDNSIETTNEILKIAFAKELAEVEAEAARVKAEEEARIARIKAYWEQHPEEYAKLTENQNIAQRLLRTPPKDLTSEQQESVRTTLKAIKEELNRGRAEGATADSKNDSLQKMLEELEVIMRIADSNKRQRRRRVRNVVIIPCVLAALVLAATITFPHLKEKQQAAQQAEDTYNELVSLMDQGKWDEATNKMLQLDEDDRKGVQKFFKDDGYINDIDDIDIIRAAINNLFDMGFNIKEACTILGIDNNPEEGIHILHEIGYSAYQARIILGID